MKLPINEINKSEENNEHNNSRDINSLSEIILSSAEGQPIFMSDEGGSSSSTIDLLRVIYFLSTFSSFHTVDST